MTSSLVGTRVWRRKRKPSCPNPAAVRSGNSMFWEMPPGKATGRIRGKSPAGRRAENDTRRNCIIEPCGSGRRRYAGDHVLGYVSHEFGPDYLEGPRTFYQHRVRRHLPRVGQLFELHRGPSMGLSRVQGMWALLSSSLGPRAGRLPFALGVTGSALVAAIVSTCQINRASGSLDLTAEQAPFFYGAYFVSLGLAACWP